MTSYLIRRIPSALAVLVIASILIFVILRLVPGGPESVLSGGDATPEQVAHLRHELGLDRNIVAQYLSWVGGIVTGHLGTSYVIGGSIADLVGYGLGNTVILALGGIIVAVVFALALSLTSVLSRSRVAGAAVTVINALAIALPVFVVGTLLVLVVGINLQWLPAGGTPPDGFGHRWDLAWQYLVLPAVTLGLPTGAVLARFLTESLGTELRQSYVTTATALGVSRTRIVLRHVLPNALPPALTVFGIAAGGLLGGAVLVESIFAWPGLGLLLQEAIDNRDYPLVQVLLLVAVAVFVLIQLVTDVAYALLDPRIRLGASA
ncbi:MAG: ABC transporter permease [Gordonia sp. (in: high G+C Gram-positive bacteria)]